LGQIGASINLHSRGFSGICALCERRLTEPRCFVVNDKNIEFSALSATACYQLTLAVEH